MSNYIKGQMVIVTNKFGHAFDVGSVVIIHSTHMHSASCFCPKRKIHQYLQYDQMRRIITPLNKKTKTI